MTGSRKHFSRLSPKCPSRANWVSLYTHVDLGVMNSQKQDDNALAMEVEAIRATRDPHDSCWALSFVPEKGTSVLLVGWIMKDVPTDAGVPAEIAKILTEVLCDDYRVAFLHPTAAGRDESGWRTTPRGLEQVLRPGLGGRVLREPLLPVICTSEARTAALMFRAEPYSWQLRSQLVMLFPLGSEAHLSYDSVFKLWRRSANAHYAAELGAEGLMLPGVDGDFAELVFFLEPQLQRSARRLEQACQQAGIGWQVVSECDFKSTSWFGRHI